MTKRRGTHKLQRDRRRQALAARLADPNHQPAQVWDKDERQWLKK